MITRRSNAAGLALLVLVAAGAACTPAATPATNRVFLSVAVTDGEVDRPLLPDTRISLSIDGTNLGANAGCNSMAGTYRIESGTLVLDPPTQTEMNCGQPLRDQEDWLLEFLSSRPAFRLAGDELTIQSGTVVIRLLDRTIVEPDLTLVGPTWTVDAILEGDAGSDLPGATATIDFNADGSLTLDAGCNKGGGMWAAVAGGGLELSNIVLTRKTCSSGPRGPLEASVMAVLGAGRLTAEITWDTLHLHAGSKGLRLRGS